MQETTGKQTKKPGLTWLGAAKPDDPIFKEGWSVSVGLGLWQQPPESSDSTTDEVDEEADESED